MSILDSWRTQTWKNVPGYCNLCMDAKILARIAKALPVVYEILKNWEDYQLLLYFRSSGYYTPMSMYGGPDHLGWPAEGDDERLMEKVEIDDAPPLSPQMQQELFDLFIEEINKVELEDDRS